MTYPTRFLRLVASGTLYNVEGFSWSLSLIPNGGSVPSPPSTVPAAVASAVSAFHGQAGFISNAARLTTLKLNLIGTDGRYVSQEDSVTHDYTTAVPGGANPTAGVPPQIALAITLRTPVRRGLASSGRFYVPVPHLALSTDGRLGEAMAQAAAGYATTMLDAINAAMPDWRVGVVSDVGAGAARPVTRVEVGRVLDTIRSRRTSLPEAHVEGADLAGTFAGGGGAF